MMNFSIKKKLFLSFACMLAIMIFFAFFRGAQLNMVMERYNDAMQTIVVRQRHIGQIVTSLNRMRFNTITAAALYEHPDFLYQPPLISEKEHYIEIFLKYLSLYREDVLADVFLSPSEIEERITIVDSITLSFHQYYLPAVSRIDLALKERNQEEIVQALALLTPASNLLADSVWELMDKTFEFAVYITKTMRYYDGLDERLFNVATIIGIAVAILLTITFAHTVQNPIYKLNKSVVSFGTDEKTKLFGLDRGDEIGDLARTIQSLLDNELEHARQTSATVNSLLDASPMFIEIWDGNLNLVDCNERAVNLLGLKSKEEFIERYYELSPEFQPCGTPTREKGRAHLEKALHEGFAQCEWIHLTADGSELPVEATFVRLEIQGKTMIVEYNHDLRQVKKAMAEMQRIGIAEASNQAKSRFLARMSHEIRTPITAVLGIAEIELQSSNLPPRLEEAFAKIHNSSGLLLGIINDILDLSRIEAGKMTLLYEDYDLASVIGNITNMHLANFSAKGIKFNLNIDENLPVMLTGDFVRIEQIMNNLLSNALKFTESGSVQLSFSCRKNEEKEGYATLVIEVSDTGFGLTQEQLDSMRSEYIRYHETERPYIGGTGLGMPIVYSLVEMMNGKIDIKSKVGKGTKVTVYIPQKISGSEVLGKEMVHALGSFEVDASSTTKRMRFTPEPMPYGKVLVVDDVEANLYVAKGLLNFYGLNIETCESGHGAIAKVKEGKVYDIIFMDQMMPSLNGDEAMRILRSMGYTHPIVALTANALIGQAERFIKDGFDGFISKPIQTKPLHSILVKFIKDKQTPQIIEAAKAQAPADNANIEDYLNDSELIAKLRVKFVETQDKAITNIKNALEQDDIKTAHRLAHTLKSSAALIKENTLSSIAKEMEFALAKKDIPAPEQFSALEEELARVLKSIDVPQAKPLENKDFDKDAAGALFDKLIPLLEARNAAAIRLLDELREIPQTAVIVKHIEEFDFDIALKNLVVLRETLR